MRMHTQVHGQQSLRGSSPMQELPCVPWQASLQSGLQGRRGGEGKPLVQRNQEPGDESLLSRMSLGGLYGRPVSSLWECEHHAQNSRGAISDEG